VPSVRVSGDLVQAQIGGLHWPRAGVVCPAVGTTKVGYALSQQAGARLLTGVSCRASGIEVAYTAQTTSVLHCPGEAWSRQQVIHYGARLVVNRGFDPMQPIRPIRPMRQVTMPPVSRKIAS
jgi:hypothetical protein